MAVERMGTLQAMAHFAPSPHTLSPTGEEPDPLPVGRRSPDPVRERVGVRAEGTASHLDSRPRAVHKAYLVTPRAESYNR